MRWTTRKAWLAIGVPVIAALIFIPVIQWDGAFTVPVTILADGESVSPNRVASVRYGEAADASMIALSPRETDSIINALPKAVVKEGKYLVRVPCGGSESLWGLWMRNGQAHRLCLRVDLTNGRHLGIDCPVTDKAKRPSITIDIGDLDAQPRPD
ncbi:MAG: hypothetical protein WCS43_16315 [Verrucomicrobiota bacterium]